MIIQCLKEYHCFGKNFADKLLNISFEKEFIKIEGYISKEIQSESKYKKQKV